MEQWQKRDAPNVIVEAIRLNEDNAEEVARWCRAEVVEEIDAEYPDETQVGLNIFTPSGNRRASLGMYVVKFGRHFFAAHTRPFELKYKPVNRPTPPPESSGETRRRLGFADPFEGRSPL